MSSFDRNIERDKLVLKSERSTCINTCNAKLLLWKVEFIEQASVFISIIIVVVLESSAASKVKNIETKSRKKMSEPDHEGKF